VGSAGVLSALPGLELDPAADRGYIYAAQLKAELAHRIRGDGYE
jgi:hypothetical protein